MQKPKAREYTTESFFKKIVGEVVEEKLDKRLAKLEERLFERLHKENEEMYGRYRDDIMTKLDAFIKEVRDVRDEQSGHQIQHNDIRSELDQLNKIHPQGRHATV